MPCPSRRCLRLCALVGCALAVGCGGGGPETAAPAHPPAPPAACETIRDARELADRLAPDGAGAALCLAPGVYEGPWVIARTLVLWGPPDAVVRSGGSGSTVVVDAPGASLLGFTIAGSGTRFDQEDAALRVRADNVTVEGLAIRDALFGITVERARGVTLRANRIVGDGHGAMGLRGDSIRLWETDGSRVIGNEVHGGRDVVVWYSRDNEIARNTVVGGRYGSHLMYSHRNRVVGNVYGGNVVGVFVMYSNDVIVEGNRVADSGGSAGMALGIKESGNLEVRGNDLVRNTVGLYLDSSPLQTTHRNVIVGNRFRRGGTGVLFHGPSARNRIADNDFRDNRHAVRVEGGGTVTDAQWLHNHFSDYEGYDLDGDGRGDVPYRLASLSEDLRARFPALDFFEGLPVLALIAAVGRAFPLFAPRTLLSDPQPRMVPLGGTDAR